MNEATIKRIEAIGQIASVVTVRIIAVDRDIAAKTTFFSYHYEHGDKIAAEKVRDEIHTLTDAKMDMLAQVASYQNEVAEIVARG